MQRAFRAFIPPVSTIFQYSNVVSRRSFRVLGCTHSYGWVLRATLIEGCEAATRLPAMAAPSRTASSSAEVELSSEKVDAWVLETKEHATQDPRTGRFPVVIDEGDLTEEFVKGGGKGGQKVNKSSNKVQLTHIPSGLVIHCHRTRSLAENRKIARSKLRLKLDELLNGSQSKVGQRAARQQRRKRKAAQRARKKYGDNE